MTRRSRRTAAEWVTFAVSSAVLLGVLALILLQTRGADLPAAPVAEVSSIERQGDLFHAMVTVRNEGDATAANVQVVASVTVDGEAEDSDQVVDFLAGKATEQLVFVFDEDPSEHDLVVRVAGFTDP